MKAKINQNTIFNLTKKIIKYNEINLLNIGFHEHTPNIQFVNKLLYNQTRLAKYFELILGKIPGYSTVKDIINIFNSSKEGDHLGVRC